MRQGSTSTVIGLGILYSGSVTGAIRPGLFAEWRQYRSAGEGTSAGTTPVTGQNVEVLWLRLTCDFSLAPGS